MFRWLCWHPKVTLVLGGRRPPFQCQWCGKVSYESDHGPWQELEVELGDPGRVELVGLSLTQEQFEAVLSVLPDGTVVEFRHGWLTDMAMEMSDWDHLDIEIKYSWLEARKSSPIQVQGADNAEV